MRGEFLRRLSRIEEAREAFDRALFESTKTPKGG